MGNKCVKDPYIRVLLDRREEIKNEINKLQAEYSAIGELIRRDYNHRHPHPLDIEKGEER